VATDVPLREALNMLLGHQQLAYRAVDGRTLQVLSHRALRERLEAELFPVADLLAKVKSPAALIDRIQNELAGATWKDAGGPGDIDFDPASASLIVLQSQDVNNRLEALLEAWRKNAPSAPAAVP
jgi:hypothetical protein